ncbi:hypothetical protein NSK_008307, partial [Nannochloropsis salina CCMP1776]
MSERRRPKASGKGEGTSTCYSRASDADSRQAYVWEDVYTAEVGSLWNALGKMEDRVPAPSKDTLSAISSPCSRLYTLPAHSLPTPPHPCAERTSTPLQSEEDDAKGPERKGITALEKLLSRLSVPATEAKVGGKGGGGGGGKGGGGRGEGRGSRKEGGQKRRKGATSGKKWYLRRGEGEGGKEGGVESTEEEIAVAQIWREGGKEGGKDGGKEGGREELDAVLAIVEAGACRVGGEGGEGQLKDRLGALLAGREEDIRRLEDDCARLANASLALGPQTRLLVGKIRAIREERRDKEGLREKVMAVNRILAQRIRDFEDKYPSSLPPSSSSSSSS